MDERVVQAMAQWPDVPDVYGWLSLDARGRWKLRAEPISNTNLIDFINRNYVRTESGSYAFQNGPQRVHVRLEATPWVALADVIDGLLKLQQHCGLLMDPIDAVYLDPEGHLLTLSNGHAALLRDHDLAVVLPFLLNAQGGPLSTQELQAWMGGEAISAALCVDGEHLELQHAPARESWEDFFDYCAMAEAG